MQLILPPRSRGPKFRRGVTVALSVFSRCSIVVVLVTLAGSHAFAQVPAAPVTGQPVPQGAPPRPEPTMPAPAPVPALAPVPAPAPDAARPRAVEFTTLRLMRDKHLISEDEYQAALRDLGEPIGARAGDASTFIFGKWSTTLYGFVQTDAMYNSTQSFNDFAGNQQVLRPGTYGGDNGRTVFSGRDSRFGVRLRAP